MKSSRSLMLIAAFMLALSGCKGMKVEKDTPMDAEQARKESRGKLTGEGGLFSLGGDNDKDKGGGTLGVNSFLWRATLDTLSFMPLASADPFGGVIITDWYEDPKAEGERFKVTALILDSTLRSDGVRVSLFKQSKDKGMWRDVQTNPSVARDLEDTILTRARQLKVGSISK